MRPLEQCLLSFAGSQSRVASTSGSITTNSRCSHGSEHSPSEPDQYELKRQTPVRHDLVAEWSITPVPGHVEVGRIDADEKSDCREGADSSRTWEDKEGTDEEFGDTACVGPEALGGG